jgi:hypothetical protein
MDYTLKTYHIGSRWSRGVIHSAGTTTAKLSGLNQPEYTYILLGGIRAREKLIDLLLPGVDACI